MPTELPFVNQPTSNPEEPIRKSEAEIFKPNIKEDEGTEIKFPVTEKPDNAIPLKKKGKPRGHNKDPEKMKEHMAKMRAKSVETRARKKAEKLKAKQPIPENKELEIQGGLPEGFSGSKPPTNTPNINQPQYSQPVDADALRNKLQELEKQNKAYKDWYTQNKQHLNNIPAQQPVQPQQNVNAGFDRLHSLEQMIRKDEREKLMNQQKSEREEQAKNLANKRHNMPAGLQKWQNMNASKHYANNEEMWADCFNPK